jgi:hypothetical protein
VVRKNHVPAEDFGQMLRGLNLLVPTFRYGKPPDTQVVCRRLQ